jgi:hypothetical protein
MGLAVILTVCVIAPVAAAEARLMTCIDWAAAMVAANGSAAKYFIMTRFAYRVVKVWS